MAEKCLNVQTFSLLDKASQLAALLRLLPLHKAVYGLGACRDQGELPPARRIRPGASMQDSNETLPRPRVARDHFALLPGEEERRGTAFGIIRHYRL